MKFTTIMYILVFLCVALIADLLVYTMNVVLPMGDTDMALAYIIVVTLLWVLELVFWLILTTYLARKAKKE